MIYEPKSHSASIVLVGSFNPAIISPAWLALHKIITSDELEGASVKVIHSEISQFSAGMASYEIFPERFQVRSSEEPFIGILDQVLLIFRGNLSHSPIRQFGINYEILFMLENPDRRLHLGRSLAPLAPWGRFGDELVSRSTGQTGGLTQLNMTDVAPENRKSGSRTAAIRPDSASATGVVVAINDHYNIEAPPETGAVPATDKLEEIFDGSLSKAKEIVEDLQAFARGL